MLYKRSNAREQISVKSTVRDICLFSSYRTVDSVTRNEKHQLKMSNKRILYNLDLSPPTRAVRVVAKLLGIELELRYINLTK